MGVGLISAQILFSFKIRNLHIAAGECFLLGLTFPQQIKNLCQILLLIIIIALMTPVAYGLWPQKRISDVLVQKT